MNLQKAMSAAVTVTFQVLLAAAFLLTIPYAIGAIGLAAMKKDPVLNVDTAKQVAVDVAKQVGDATAAWRIAEKLGARTEWQFL